MVVRGTHCVWPSCGHGALGGSAWAHWAHIHVGTARRDSHVHAGEIVQTQRKVRLVGWMVASPAVAVRTVGADVAHTPMRRSRA